MRAARKRVGFSQTTVANQLGISQSALSKIESARLVPSAPQWFAFCELAGVSPDSLTTGYLDSLRPAVLLQQPEEGFKLPRAYSTDRGSKVRAMMPFILYAKEAMGEEKFERYLESVKVDPDFFVDMDNQINLNFCLDLSKVLMDQGHLRADELGRLTQAATQGRVHGRLGTSYLDRPSMSQLLNLAFLNARQYECNFSYQLEEQSPAGLTVSIRPEKHLGAFKYKAEHLGDFLCRYKQGYFQKFATYTGGAGAQVKELQCHFHGADRCVYEFRAAS
jgi:transcriptional regulator with XRE-family HTH domain